MPFKKYYFLRGDIEEFKELVTAFVELKNIYSANIFYINS